MHAFFVEIKKMYFISLFGDFPCIHHNILIIKVRILTYILTLLLVGHILTVIAEINTPKHDSFVIYMYIKFSVKVINMNVKELNRNERKGIERREKENRKNKII